MTLKFLDMLVIVGCGTGSIIVFFAIIESYSAREFQEVRALSLFLFFNVAIITTTALRLRDQRKKEFRSHLEKLKRLDYDAAVAFARANFVSLPRAFVASKIDPKMGAWSAFEVKSVQIVITRADSLGNASIYLVTSKGLVVT